MRSFPALPTQDHDAPKGGFMEDEWGAHLRSLNFRPGPAYLSSSDGVYYFFSQATHPSDKAGVAEGRKIRDIQLIVLGPMPHSPFELAMAVSPEYWVSSLGVCEAESTRYLRHLSNNRGYWVIWLRHDRDEPRPCFADNVSVSATGTAAAQTVETP